MKVMQINCVYMKGSTGKIVYDIHTGLDSKEINTIVCYGRGMRIKAKNVYKLCSELYAKINNLISRITGIPYGGCYLSTLNLIRIIHKEKPNIIHLHCINGFFVNIYMLISWLKRKRIKTVLTLHAEFMYTANCGYSLECDKWHNGCGKCPRRKELKSLFFDKTSTSWNKMYKAFKGFEKDCIVVSVSPWLKERAQQAPILEKFCHKVIYNGVDTEKIFFSRSDLIDISQKNDYLRKKIVLYVTSSFSVEQNHIKGGWYIIQLAKRCQDINFIVIGNEDKSIELPSNIFNVGKICNQEELALYYSMANVSIITSQKETFSMVVAESLCCGTPVVGFCAGAPEIIALPEYSSFVPYGDIEALERELYKWLEKSYDKNDLQKKAHEKYSKTNMCKEYKKTYYEICGKEVCRCQN